MKRENDFFFEEWAFLAKVDPEAFERRRRKVIDEFLSNSGRQRALGEQLQREIDAVRGRAGEPLEALLAISGMLYEHLGFLGEELHVLRDAVGRLKDAQEAECTKSLPPHDCRNKL